MFTYNTTLIEIHPNPISKIPAGYKDDKYWKRLHHQVQANKDHRDDKTKLSFVTKGSHKSDSDLYISSQAEKSTNSSSGSAFLDPESPAGLSTRFKKALVKRNSTVIIEDSTLPPPNEAKVLYSIKRTIGNLRLCIPLAVASDILQIVYGKGNPAFFCCYKIVTRFWYIRGLNKLLREFIRYCFQCLQLQTRRHHPYGSLQPIESPPVAFFTLILDFVFGLPLTKHGLNAIMSVTYKFSKWVTLIKGADI